MGEKTSTVKARLTTLSHMVAIAPMAKRNDIVRGQYLAHRSKGLERKVLRPLCPYTSSVGSAKNCGEMITLFASATARAFVLRHPRSTLARLSIQRVRVSMDAAPPPLTSGARAVAIGETTSLNGTVRRVLFRADTGYTVATLDCSPEGQKAVVITSNHCLALVQPGERLSVVGRWTEHQRFGAQLQVESTSGAEVGTTPSTAEGMEELLSSRAIKGVGPKLAAALVQAQPPLSHHRRTSHTSPLSNVNPNPTPKQEFGENTLGVLLSEEREEELLRMPGIGPKTLGRIRTSARQWADSRDALGFGLSLGLSASQAYALVKKHGADSETKVSGGGSGSSSGGSGSSSGSTGQTRRPRCGPTPVHARGLTLTLTLTLPLNLNQVRANPYMLEELLDFAAVDALAMTRLDLAATSPLRAQAMVRRELKLTLAQGHCYMGGKVLEAAAARSLCCAKLKPEQAAACVRLALDTMHKKGELPTPPMTNGTASSERRFFLPATYAAEEKIAIAVRRL